MQHVEYGSGAACLRVHAADHDFRDPRLDDRTGTHRAWFQRHIHRTVLKPPVPDDPAGLPHRDDLRVGQHVLIHGPPVISPRDDLPVMHDHAADRHFF